MAITVSVVTGGSNSAATTASDINGVATDFIAQGVVGAITNTSGVAPSTGAWAVNANSGMNITLTQGVGYVSGTPTGGSSQLVRVNVTTSQSITIASNATGGTRFDWIYVKLDPDKLANPGVNKDDVATIVTSRSTSSSTDNGTPPTYGYAVAVVTVANGAASISNGNIADARTTTGPNQVDNKSTGFIPATALSTSAITLGYAQSASAGDTQSGITTITDLTNLSVAVTVPTFARRIIILASVPVNGSAANLVELSIREGSTTLSKVRTTTNGTGGWWTNPVVGYSSTSITAGAHTYKLSLALAAGSGSVNSNQSSSGDTAWIWVGAV